MEDGAFFLQACLQDIKPQAMLLIIFLFALRTVSLLQEMRRATDTFTLILTNVEEPLVMGTRVSSRQERKETRGV